MKLLFTVIVGAFSIQALAQQVDPNFVATHANYKYIHELLMKRCEQCHQGEVETLAALVKSQMIEPGNPKNSFLYIVTVNRQMPANGDYLSVDDEAAIAAWIAQLTPTPQ